MHIPNVQGSSQVDSRWTPVPSIPSRVIDSSVRQVVPMGRVDLRTPEATNDSRVAKREPRDPKGCKNNPSHTTCEASCTENSYIATREFTSDLPGIHRLPVGFAVSAAGRCSRISPTQAS